MTATETVVDKVGDEVHLLWKRPKLVSFDGVPMTPRHFAMKYWKQTRNYVPRDGECLIGYVEDYSVSPIEFGKTSFP